MEEAKKRKAGHQTTIEKEKQEISRLQAEMKAKSFSGGDVEFLRQELKALREKAHGGHKPSNFFIGTL